MPIQADYIMLFKYGQNPASLSFTFVLFKQFSEKKIVPDFNWIRTWIFRVEGMQIDHKVLHRWCDDNMTKLVDFN